MAQITETDGGAVLIEVDDPVIRSLLPDYIKRRREALAELDELLSLEDFESIRLIGHNIRGSGGAYGIEPLSELGRKLEAAAIEGDAGVAGTTIDRMRELIGRLVVKD